MTDAFNAHASSHSSQAFYLATEIGVPKFQKSRKNKTKKQQPIIMAIK